jgi:hypothetical protein
LYSTHNHLHHQRLLLLLLLLLLLCWCICSTRTPNSRGVVLLNSSLLCTCPAAHMACAAHVVALAPHTALHAGVGCLCMLFCRSAAVFHIQMFHSRGLLNGLRQQQQQQQQQESCYSTEMNYKAVKPIFKLACMLAVQQTSRAWDGLLYIAVALLQHLFCCGYMSTV